MPHKQIRFSEQRHQFLKKRNSHTMTEPDNMKQAPLLSKNEVWFESVPINCTVNHCRKIIKLGETMATEQNLEKKKNQKHNRTHCVSVMYSFT